MLHKCKSKNYYISALVPQNNDIRRSKANDDQAKCKLINILLPSVFPKKHQIKRLPYEKKTLQKTLETDILNIRNALSKLQTNMACGPN